MPSGITAGRLPEMKHQHPRPSGTAAALFLGFLLLSCQSGFIYHPDRNLAATPGAINLAYEEVRFPAADGTKLHGWWIPSRESRGAVIHCHGNAGNISHRLGIIEIFNSMGLDVLVFDYRGYGLSEGTPTEKGTYADAEGAWRYLADVKGISRERIIVHGQSLGGAIAAHLASQRQPAMVVVESSFTSTRDLARNFCSFTPAIYIILTYTYETARFAGEARCPLLVIHSRDDEMIPFSHGEKIFHAAKEPKAFLEIRGSHNGGFIQSGSVYVSGLKSFIGDHLPGGDTK